MRAMIVFRTSGGTALTMSNVTVSRRDGIHRDVLARAFERQSARKAEDARLGRGIIDLPELSLLALIELMLMMRPKFRARIPSMIARHMLNIEPDSRR